VKNGTLLRRRCKLTQNNLVSMSHLVYILSPTAKCQYGTYMQYSSSRGDASPYGMRHLYHG
ncbi:MAG TPA: hypothetical protein PLH64_10205, partial [Anaerolineaceae bacterium]|nr:hypothetical protein [Anaerolineaceae bacterium]